MKNAVTSKHGSARMRLLARNVQGLPGAQPLWVDGGIGRAQRVQPDVVAAGNGSERLLLAHCMFAGDASVASGGGRRMIARRSGVTGRAACLQIARASRLRI